MNSLIALSYFAFALMMLGTAEDSHFRNDRWMFAVDVRGIRCGIGGIGHDGGTLLRGRVRGVTVPRGTVRAKSTQKQGKNDVRLE